LEHERGALFAGARADLVAFTDDLRVLATWVGGESDDLTTAATIRRTTRDP
jgi:N-acetylglucosamine-6-phosphate deacetylase